MDKLFSGKKWAVVGVGVGSYLLVTLSFLGGFFSGLELFFEDLLFFQKPIHPDIVIVSIDNASIEHLGQWPWPRSVFGEFFERLDAVKPRVVALDVIFSEPSRLGVSDDSALADSLAAISYPVVFPIEYTEELQPLEILSGSKQIYSGYVDLIADPDGVVRSFRTNIGSLFSFALETLTRAGVEVGLSDAIERIVYAGPPTSIRHVPFYRVLADRDIAYQSLEGKIVFVGVTAPDLHDVALTPFSRGVPMAGVEIQAQIANMFLRQYRLVSLVSWLTVGWIGVVALVSTILFLLIRRLLVILCGVFVALAITLVFMIFLFDAGIVPNIVHIVLSFFVSTVALVVHRSVTYDRERRQLREVFSKYVSPAVLVDILRDPKKVVLGGEEREVTVFFSDIRSFTTVSEHLSPLELVRVLNRYFSAMGKIVTSHGGVLDKFIGDAIMAFWGAPLRDAEQADHALQAALEMLKALQDLNRDFQERGDPEIRIGIGIYTGRAVVGNVGSADRFDYTVIGDTVNVASRLEGLTKEYKVPIVFGETTKEKLRGTYPVLSLGSVFVKGRSEPLQIYTVQV